MGGIDRRKNGKWRARYRDGLGRQHSQHFDRKIDARRWLAMVEVSRSRGEWVDPALTRMPVGAWARSWRETQVQLKPSTAERYRVALDRHILPTWEKVPLAAVSYTEVSTWVAELVGGGLAPSTVRYAYRVFSLVLSDAVRAGRLTRNPAAGVPLPRLVRKVPVFLDHGQVAELAAACEPHGLLVRFLAYSGLRWGEATALRVDRVHLDRRRVTVAVAFVSMHGELVESTPKSHRHREVPMPRFLAAQLGEHIAGKGPKELVFTTESGAPLRSSNFRQRYWLDAVKTCGLAGLRVHDLRHTAASLAVKSGANPKVVQQILGHASAAMTLDVYAGLFDADLDDVADRLDAAARAAGGVSQVCPNEGVEGIDEAASEGQDDDDDGLGGVAARVG
jgi:integrase